jgi:hypothetical protein
MKLVVVVVIIIIIIISSSSSSSNCFYVQTEYSADIAYPLVC